MTRLTRALRRLWAASRPLTAVGLGMTAVFVLSVAAMAIDPRTIGGAPAWLKPAKFAISTAIYALTLAWIVTALPRWPRLTRMVGWITAAVLVVEVLLIDIQAARATTSHFNVGTAADAAIFGVMGFSIVLAWAASVALTVALFRQRFADSAVGWAMRLGMLLTVLGSATGGLMTGPTAAQIERARSGGGMPLVGAHTVGAPDGAPGLPGTGWSRAHGDLRVPHFLGLHAVQALPLFAWAIGRFAGGAGRRRAVLAGAAAYASLFGILLAQALSGQPLLAPQGAVATALAAWTGCTIAAIAWTVGNRAAHTR